MIVSTISPTPVTHTIGMYASSTSCFRADFDLTGKVVRYSPALYIDRILPTVPVINNPAFQMIFPAIGVTVEMTNLGHTNYKAFLKAIDEYNYCITVEFIVGASSGGFSLTSQTNNSLLLSQSGHDSYVGHFTKVDSDTQHSYQDVLIKSVECSFQTSFLNSIGASTDGYIVGDDLDIIISTNETIESNFFVGFYNKNIVDNTDVFDGIGLNYAFINSQVNTVLDEIGNAVPNTCIISGSGFVNSGGESIAQIKIDGSCLTVGQTYGLYIIYKKDGQFKTCILDPITGSGFSFDGLDITLDISDALGNSSLSCVTGLHSCVAVDVCPHIVKTEIDTILSSFNLTETFDDVFVSVTAISTNDEEGSFGIDLTVTGDSESPCTSYKPAPDFTGDKYIVFLWEFRIGNEDFFIKYIVKLSYSNTTQEITPTITDEDENVVESLCSDTGTYTIDDGTTDCLEYISINGAEYVAQSLLDNLDTVGEICVKKICAGDDGGDNCPPCPTVELEITNDYDSETTDGDLLFCGPAGSIITVNGLTNDTSCFDYGYNGEPNIGYTVVIVLDGCSYTKSGTITIATPQVETFDLDSEGTTDCDEDCPSCGEITIDIYNDYDQENTDGVVTFTGPEGSVLTLDGFTDGTNFYAFGYNGTQDYNYDIQVEKNGCIWTGFGTIAVTEDVAKVQFLTSTGFEDCDTDDDGEADCNNSAFIDFDCIDGTITINLVENFASVVESSELLCSTDGGITFIPCPSTIVGESSVIVTFDVQFEDSCDDIHIEQTIECNTSSDCAGYVNLMTTITDCELSLAWTDSIDILTVISDTLSVDGVTYDPTTSYTPISLSGSGSIEVIRTIIFNNGCTDLIFSKSVNYDCTTTPTDNPCDLCDNYTIDLVVDTESEPSTVSWSLSGDLGLINSSAFFFSWNGENPLKTDSNGNYCGMPTSSVNTKVGKGFFAIGAILNIEGCTESCMIFADAYIDECCDTVIDPCTTIGVIIKQPGEDTKVILPKGD